MKIKGIVTDYFEDKGFGFIRDENEEKIFFHISQIINKEKFLINMSEYYYSNHIERDCYVIKFNVVNNEKGKSASEIELTTQIFNGIASGIMQPAKITNIEYLKDSLTRTVSGIKKGMSKPVGSTAGGNGTYRLGYPEVYKELNIHYRKTNEIGWGTIEVRETILNVNNRTKITTKFATELHQNLVGKTINLVLFQNEWKLLNSHELRI